MSQPSTERLAEALRRVIGWHTAPQDCYSTGPLTGTVLDATCPSCEGMRLLEEYDAAHTSAPSPAGGEGDSFMLIAECCNGAPETCDCVNKQHRTISTVPLPHCYAYSHESAPRKLWDADDMRDYAIAVAAHYRAEIANLQAASPWIAVSPEGTVSRYVVGFMFDPDRKSVALIRKSKPAWQAGLLNGIGGKIEPGESDCCAMVREFREECGVSTDCNDWTHFLRMAGRRDVAWDVECYATIGDLSDCRTMEGEPVEVVSLDSINPTTGGMIENLPWIIALALDSLADERPLFTIAHYDIDSLKGPLPAAPTPSPTQQKGGL